MDAETELSLPKEIDNPIDWSRIPKEAQRSFSPREHRSQGRIAERELETLHASLSWDEGRTWHTAQLLDLSRNGFCLLLSESPSQFTVGKRMDLRLNLSKGQSYRYPSELRRISQNKRGWICGFRLADVISPNWNEEKLGLPFRLYQRFALPGTLDNPLLYLDTAWVDCIAIFPGGNLLLRSNDEALFLALEARLKIHFQLPTQSAEALEVRVRSIKHDVRFVTFLVEPIVWIPSLAQAFADYLLDSVRIPPQVFRGLGIFSKHYDNHIRYSYVVSEHDYHTVLELRRNAYVAAGKKPPETTPSDMSSLWDNQSRILIAEHGEKLVASVALAFPTGNENFPTRTESLFPDNKLPENYGNNSDMIEIMQLCTHESYRGGDLLFGIFERISRNWLLSQRRILITCCTDALLPLYLRIGFKNTGHMGQFFGIPHHLIIHSRERLITCSGINPLLWAGLLGNMFAELLDRNLIQVTQQQRFKMRCLLLLAPLSRWVATKRYLAEFDRAMKKRVGPWL